MHRLSRKAFTLIELVVVVMILGILAAVAVPKLINTSRVAVDNGMQTTLSVVRDAVEMYVAENNGELPGLANDLPGDLAQYLRGAEFPSCPVGPQQNASVDYVAGDGTTPLDGDANPTTSWRYDQSTGEFICNYDSRLASDNMVSYDEL